MFRLISLISLIAKWEIFVSTLSQEPMDGLLPNFKYRCNMRFSWTDYIWQNSVCKIKDGRHFSNYWFRWLEKSEAEIHWFSPDLKYRCNIIISRCVDTLRKFGLQNSRWPSFKDFSLITDLWNYFSEDRCNMRFSLTDYILTKLGMQNQKPPF